EAGVQSAPPAKLAPPAGGGAPPDGKNAPATGTQPAPKGPPANAPPGAKNGKVPLPPGAGGAARLPAIGGPGGPPGGPALNLPAGENASLTHNRLVLKDGKAATTPTAYVGATRVRATLGPPARDGESNIGLQISLEPKLLWRRLTALRPHKAIDDQGQT